MMTQIKLGDIAVDVVLKDIKNVHLSVYPPTGRVRISAPQRMSLDTIRVFAISKLDWIKQQQTKLREQERETPREYLDRESHYVWGKRYLLKVVESDGPPVSRAEAQPHAPAGAAGHRRRDKRQALVEAWYREQLKEAVPPLIARWEPLLGVERGAVLRAADEDQVGQLQPGRAHDPPQHRAGQEAEGVPRVHRGARDGPPARADPQRPLRALMDQFMPNWRHRRENLNRLPIGHRTWVY